MFSSIVSAKARFGLAIGTVVLTLGLWARPAWAATITVDADCSLADAITAANTDSNTHNADCTQGSGRDTIQLSGTITLSESLPNITASVDIRGPSGGYATIDGQGNRIITIIGGANTRVSNLILQKGADSAILSFSDLTVSNVHFRNNTSNTHSDDSASAGAIYIEADSLSIYDSTFTDNSQILTAYQGSVIIGEVNTLVGRNLLFARNGREQEGGGALIYLAPYNSNVSWTLTGATFENNLSSGFNVERSGLTLNNLKYRNNRGILEDSLLLYPGHITINCLLEFRNNSPNRLPDNVTVNDCPDDDNDEPEPVVVSAAQTIAHNEQVIAEEGYEVAIPHGLGTIVLKALDPADCGAIGNQAVCDMDVLQVADVSAWAEQGIRFCFRGYGRVLFVPSHDANGQPDQPEDGGA